LADIPLGTPGVRDVPLPKALPPTPFAQWEGWTLVIQLLVAALMARFLPMRRNQITPI